MWVRFGEDERRNERALPTLGRSEGYAVREDVFHVKHSSPLPHRHPHIIHPVMHPLAYI